MSSKKISVVIPARNEEECLPRMIEELPKDMIHEIIVVDGYSTDRTAEVVREMGYKVVPQESGRGYGYGVETGIKHATGEYVTFMDADGSYDPEALTRLQNTLEKGYDAVFCSRYLPESGSDDDTFIRWLGNMMFTWMIRFVHGVKLSDSLFLYMLCRREVFSQIDTKSQYFEWCIEFPIKLHGAGFKYAEIPSRERPRMAGDSKVNAVIDGVKILWWMLKLKFSGEVKSAKAKKVTN